MTSASKPASTRRSDRPRAFVDVDASFGTLDLNRFVSPTDPSAGPVPTTAATPVDLQPLKWVDARLRLQVARLLRPPYRVDGLELQAGVDNGVLDLQRLAGRAWGGRFDASGSADAGSGQLRLRVRANDVDSARVARRHHWIRRSAWPWPSRCRSEQPRQHRGRAARRAQRSRRARAAAGRSPRHRSCADPARLAHGAAGQQHHGGRRRRPPHRIQPARREL